MSRPMRRYLLNVNSKTVHDRAHLSEGCNTDQIEKKRYEDYPPKSYQPCEHCMVPKPHETGIADETANVVELEVTTFAP